MIGFVRIEWDGKEYFLSLEAFLGIVIGVLGVIGWVLLSVLP